MTRRSSSREKASLSNSLISDGICFWCALSVLIYSLLIPLFAFESMSLATSLTQLYVLCQAAVLILVIFGVLDIVGELMTQGWRGGLALKILAVICLLSGLQPNSNCCSNLVAWIARAIPLSEVNVAEIGLHLATIVGSAIVVTNSLQPRNRSG